MNSNRPIIPQLVLYRIWLPAQQNSFLSKKLLTYKPRKKLSFEENVDVYFVESLKKEHQQTKDMLKSLKEEEKKHNISHKKEGKGNLYDTLSCTEDKAIECILNISNEQDITDQLFHYLNVFSATKDYHTLLRSKIGRIAHEIAQNRRHGLDVPASQTVYFKVNHADRTQAILNVLMLVNILVAEKKATRENNTTTDDRNLKEVDNIITELNRLTNKITKAEKSTKDLVNQLYPPSTAQLPEPKTAEKSTSSTIALTPEPGEQEFNAEQRFNKLFRTLKQKINSRLSYNTSKLLRDIDDSLATLRPEDSTSVNRGPNTNRKITTTNDMIKKLRTIGRSARIRLAKRGFFNNLFFRKNKEIYEALSALEHTTSKKLEADLAIALLPLLSQDESVLISMSSYKNKLSEIGIETKSIAAIPEIMEKKLPKEKIQIQRPRNKKTVDRYFEELYKKIKPEQPLADKEKFLDFFAERTGQTIPNSILVSTLATELKKKFSLTTVKKYLDKLTTSSTQEEQNTDMDNHFLRQLKADITNTYEEVKACFPRFFSCCAEKQLMPPGVRATKMVLDNPNLTISEKIQLIKAIGTYKKSHDSWGPRSDETWKIYDTAAAAA